MSKNLFGHCRLCGKQSKLTYEHVPPEKAFNSNAVKLISFEDSIDLLPNHNKEILLNTSKIKGKINQRGNGDYYLCAQCNNNTGSWYMQEYVAFTNTMGAILSHRNSNNQTACTFEILDLYPLKLFKAVMTMFCDINANCFNDESLRCFLLDKECTEFNHDKYSVYLYLTNSTLTKTQPISAVHLMNVGTMLISEIACAPIGVALYINRPTHYIPHGIYINDLAKVNYNEQKRVQFDYVPLLEVNTPFPGDYRTKDEILDDIDDDSIY